MISIAPEPPLPSKVEISKRLVLINSASSLMTMVLNVTVLVWLQQFLLKRISPEEYSLLPVLYSVMMFAPLLTVALTSGLARFVTEAYAKGDEQRVTQIVSTMFPILLATGALVGAFGWLMSRNIDRLLTIAPENVRDARLMLALLMFSLAIRLPVAPFGVGLQVRQRFILANQVAIAGQILRLIILFVLLFSVSIRVLWVIVATISSEMVTLLVIQWLSCRALPALKFRPSGVEWPIAGELLSFGGWSTISAIAIAIKNNSDAIILNKLGTPLDVTCFYLGSLPLRYIHQAAGAVQGPLQPALTAMHAIGAKSRLSAVFLKGGRWALWFSLFSATPLIVYGREFINLYVGTEYAVAGVVMSMLLLLFPIAYGSYMLFSIAQASANMKKLSLCLIGRDSFNLCVTLILVGVLKMGAIGSSLGTGLALGIFYPLFLWPLGREMVGVSFGTWSKETLWPGLLPAISELIVFIALKQIVPLNTWLNLCLCAACGSLFYAFTLWWVLRPEDRRDLRKAYDTMLAYSRASTGLWLFGRTKVASIADRAGDGT